MQEAEKFQHNKKQHRQPIINSLRDLQDDLAPVRQEQEAIEKGCSELEKAFSEWQQKTKKESQGIALKEEQSQGNLADNKREKKNRDRK